MNSKAIITIHQPEHLPWLGFFNKMAKARKFVILDSVPFRKNYFQNRNKILGTNGVQWLSVPVVMKGHTDSCIKDIDIAYDINPKWQLKYLRTIQNSYKKYDYFDEVFPVIREIIMKNYNKLCDLNIDIIKTFAQKIGINVEFVCSSELDVSGKKSDLILDICKKLHCQVYLSGPSGRDYLNFQSFKEADIVVKYNDYFHPVYQQKKTENFEPYLSCLDLLMNHGFQKAYELFMEGNYDVALK